MPCASVALQLTVVVPSGNVAPLVWSQETMSVAMSTMSNEEVAKVAGAPDGPVASKVRLFGTVTVGAVVSRTVTVNVTDAWLLWASNASQVTVVVLVREKVDPDAGVQLTATEPSTISLADAENVTTAPAGLVASVVMSLGAEIDGAVVSTTSIRKVDVALFPCESVDVHETVVLPSGNVSPEL